MDNKPFHIKRNDLTDGSTIWEVRCRGNDQRIGSAASSYQAAYFADALNDVCQWFAARDIHNSIDT